MAMSGVGVDERRRSEHEINNLFGPEDFDDDSDLEYNEDMEVVEFHCKVKLHITYLTSIERNI